MNSNFRVNLPGTDIDYFDTRSAIDSITSGAYDKLPYTSKVLAENLVRKCDPGSLTDSLMQILTVNVIWISPGFPHELFATIFWDKQH